MSSADCGQITLEEFQYIFILLCYHILSSFLAVVIGGHGFIGDSRNIVCNDSPAYNRNRSADKSPKVIYHHWF